MATFLTADQHYFHEGIVRLTGRPFRNAKEMNSALRDAHNSAVTDSDDVIFVGDFSHRASDHKELRALFDSLAGRKHLVVGNHDRPDLLPWASVHEVLHTSIDSQAVTLCHYAMRIWPRQRKGALMLYGHSHGRLPGNSQSMDVGVDVMGWAPCRLSTIKKRLAQLPPLEDPEVDIIGNDGVRP